jgi:glutamate transport system ATP-binding protein
VQRLANYIIFMADGKIIECGTPADFFNNPQTTAAKQFLKFSAGLLV